MLDIRTLIAGAALVDLVLSAALYVYWRTQKTYAGFGYWLASSAVVAVIYPLFGLRGILPDALTIPLPNALVVLAAVLRLESIARFMGAKRPARLHYLLPAIAFIALAYFTFVSANVPMRNSLVALPISVYTFWIAWILVSRRTTEPGVLIGFASVLFALHGLLAAARAILWHVTPIQHSVFESTPTNSLYFVSVLGFDLGWTAAYMMLSGQRLTGELRDVSAQMERLASIDALTGVLNRRGFFLQGLREIVRSRRHGHRMSVVMFDVDRFKSVNDRLGHAAGDEVLKAITRICLKCLRQSDTLGRLGGDEFALALPETDLAGAQAVTAKIQREVESQVVEWGAMGIRVTLSAGAAELCEEDSGLEDLLHRADVALFAEKEKHPDRGAVIRPRTEAELAAEV